MYERKVDLRECGFGHELELYSRNIASEILASLSEDPQKCQNGRLVALLSDLPVLGQKKEDESQNTQFFKFLVQNLIGIGGQNGIDVKVDLFNPNNQYDRDSFPTDSNRASNNGLIYHFIIQRENDEDSIGSYYEEVRPVFKQRYKEEEEGGRVCIAIAYERENQVVKMRDIAPTKAIGKVYLAIEKISAETNKESTLEATVTQ